MTPKQKRAHDIIQAVSAQSPYKDTDQRMHYQWVLGYVAGALSDALDSDSRLLTRFIRRLKR
jgi:hypothetical protein